MVLDSDFLPKTALWFRIYKALMAANRLGIFSDLASGARTATELSMLHGWHPAATERFLDALCAVGLIDRLQDGFHNSVFAQEHLRPGVPGYLGDMLRFHDLLGRGWDRLEDVLTTGEPTRSLEELLAEPDFARRYVRGMVPTSEGPAREIAMLLGDEPIARILDLGAGPGIYSVRLLERFPEAIATLLDLPTAQAVARELLATSPVRERLQFLAGDYRSVPFPRGCDLVLLSHITHDESEDAVRDLVVRAHSCLRPGGRILIHDWAMGAEHSSPAWEALFSLYLMTYTSGRVYQRDEYVRFLSEAGFKNVKVHPIGGPQMNPTLAFLGTKISGRGDTESVS